MQKFAKFFSWFVILLYFVLGFVVLISPWFHLSKEGKIIFATFLFLYGGFRVARLWTKNRERREE